MRLRFCVSILVLAAGLIQACGDDSGATGPSGRKSAITVSGVTLGADGKLEAQVDVVVKDDAGEPMEGIELLLETSRPEADEIVGGNAGVTDATGGAVFHVRTSRVGSSDIKVTLPGRDVILGPVTVDFSLDLALYLGRSLLVEPGVRVEGRVVVRDAEGPLVGVTAQVQSGDPAVTVAQSTNLTDDQGGLPFRLESQDARTTEVSLHVAGLEGAIPAGTVDLRGPTISGRISRTDGIGVVDSLRVGLLFVDYRTWNDRGVGTPQEIVSRPVTLDASGTADYELELPLRVPPEHILTTRDGMDFAPYMVVLYDDVGLLPGVMDEGDLLVGLDWTLPQVVFLGGHLSDGQGYVPGYNMMFLLQAQDLTRADPWDDWSASMDLPLDRGTVRQVTVRGTLQCANAQCDGQNWIVAAVVFDMHARDQEAWQEGHFEVVASMPVQSSETQDVPYSLDLPELVSHDHYDDWSGELLPTLTGNGFALVAFRDQNGDGKPSPYQGEPLVLPKQPWGAVGPLGWYLHPGFDWGLPLVWSGLHAGYALFLLPWEATIQQVHPAEHRLVLDQEVEAGHSNYGFRILRDTAQGRIQIVDGQDLDTGSGGNDVTTRVDLTAVQPGDVLQVTQEVTDMTFVGYSGVTFRIP